MAKQENEEKIDAADVVWPEVDWGLNDIETVIIFDEVLAAERNKLKDLLFAACIRMKVEKVQMPPAVYEWYEDLTKEEFEELFENWTGEPPDEVRGFMVKDESIKASRS